METALRLILLLLGVVIVAGIVWDSRRGRLAKKKKTDALAAEVAGKEPIVPYFDDVKVIVKSEKQEPTLQDTQIREEIITLNIMARKPNTFSGKKLKNAFADAHLYYGEMQIYHRFDNSDGSGARLFSIVSSVEPGSFDLSTMESLETPGITLFFVRTTPNHSVYAFELMLRTAKQLAMCLEGELKDDRHRILTPQIIEGYRDRIRVQPTTELQTNIAL